MTETGPPPAATTDPVVALHGIEIGFPGVKALDGVDLRLFPGEVHALMGENGAGKSTLIKALTGVHGIDAGTLTVRGERRGFAGPGHAQEAGIATVYQEVNLCPNLSVAENIMLGREPRAPWWGGRRIDRAAVRRTAVAVLGRLGLDLDPASLVGDYPLAVQQLVAIARAVATDLSVLILDEPTSSLDAGEVRELFRVIRELRDAGVAILFVSHFLDQVYEIADRTTILRNGRLVGEYAIADLPRLEMVSKMVGHALEELEDLDRQPAGEGATRTGTPFLDARGVGRAAGVAPADLAVHPGEVVGVAGLLGSGRTELVRLLFGADRTETGSIRVDGREVTLGGPTAAVAERIAFCSEDRKGEGIIADLSVRENIVLALQARRGWARRIPRRTADTLVGKWISALDVRPADPDALVGNLSGGNQQKVLLARWLITDPKLLILDEPTRGIDIGAKTQIQKLVAELAGDGMAVVFVSAELEEVVRLSDRIAVLRDRRKVAELSRAEASTAAVMEIVAEGGTHRGTPAA
ncbi:sugar ABC transporter ATP-binding protein [Pseudonocardia alni]|uniref:sugar ABC transporter ATP-binding protein n=1 Tax=Pseudonocardia alni TaxID=33907 RepID=UPI001AD75021|nr:sugar ABC transporter ATP-binding protein [Pseudonocardia alni]MBO4236264.1 ATP-binding cassette domain-containing protein [Pseudonocardia alni]